MDANRSAGASLSAIRTVAETGSTNADLLALVKTGADEGFWLRAERQTAGRGRQGRVWESPLGNFYGSTLVRLRPGDPAAATLGFVAAVALFEVVVMLLGSSPSPFRGCAAPSLSQNEREQFFAGERKGENHLRLKWPNDLLVDGGKLSGILLERAEDVVVVGIGVNLADHPDLADRRTTSLALHGVPLGAEPFAVMLAESFSRELDRWRAEGFGVIRTRWLDRAHPRGTALSARMPDGTVAQGLFDGLDPDGALILCLASGERRTIHAADVFLV